MYTLFYFHIEAPFVGCCEEYLDPALLLANETGTTKSPATTTTVTETTIESSTTDDPAMEVQCPKGYEYNSNDHVCDDTNEVIESIEFMEDENFGNSSKQVR